jgi:hypothetical protein
MTEIFPGLVVPGAYLQRKESGSGPEHGLDPGGRFFLAKGFLVLKLKQNGGPGPLKHY